jgi:endonuclease YncB( thermonuclease family)
MLRHCAAVVLCLPLLTWADLAGRVVGVADGDTLTVLTADHQRVVVHLTEIDTPEKSQPFGMRSKQSLSDLCFDRLATVASTRTDRYGRTLGRVACADVDANAAQIQRGMAWVYDRYVTDRALYADQATAQAKKIGLWSDLGPVAPWAYRHAKR